ncbi:MAG: metallophosphoesterase [Bacillota bacterium]|nr:metallophosphoesterase [Bacillota bacterium]
MPLLNEMTDRLRARIDAAQTPYDHFVYFADVHYKSGTSNSGFEKILNRISQEKDGTLFILIGGDMIDSGSVANYTAFIERCNAFFNQTGIPVIPTMGNHEFYGVNANVDEISRYKQYMGEINFPLSIPGRGLGDSVSVVAFNDAKPHKLEKIIYPNISQSCVNRSNTKHLFYFPHNYIRLSALAPEKYSHFPDYLNSAGAASNHILVTMHVPPRKNPLENMLDTFIRNEYSHCLLVNPVISLSALQSYYRNLWMLVHGNSTADKNDSTQWFVDEIKNRSKVELILMGHVHTYYTFALTEANHNLQMVISGGGGNNSAQTYDNAQPVTKYHYIRVRYDAALNRFITSKVDVGN